ncbi:hypothetical protein scyTo_0024550 [Scyliorhinus torazame]|uniref:SAMD1-like winged helix (WH) domain-containing protein n=1 Tax=Scyliorhinus torazame TaxID=75743 RepID=A0A401QFN2_SCYTO|nr:hypothetical protein [Scyliorhinus torazame]
MELQYTEWILETIDSLRSRKARPDLERICRMIERRHGLPPAETQQQLDKLVRAELVVKVAYKGSNSYRNAAKWYKNKQRKRGGAAAGAAPGGSGILQAVHSLLLQRRREEVVEGEEEEEEEPHQQTQQEPQQPLQQTQQTHQQDPQQLQQELQQAPQQHREPLLDRHSNPRGVSLRDIERHLGRKLGRARLQVALRREVHRGRLLQTPAGTHYLLPPGSGEPTAGSPAGAPPARKQPAHTVSNSPELCLCVSVSVCVSVSECVQVSVCE